MWQLRPVDPSPVAALSRALQISPTLARILCLRGYQTPEAARAFLDAREDLAVFQAPIATPGMEKAVARLRQAFATNELICIYGDYDADGVTSTALLYRYLKFGPKANVEAYLPDRFIDGYGINAAAVRRLAAEGRKLIVTCDNGISAVEAARVAKELGVDLIVTDHHQVPEVLPDAYALVHPKLEFPHLADLSGVGVALLLVIALEDGWNDRLYPMLDLVALGSVADVVPLNGPNRSLVWAGLKHIRTTDRLRPGLKALIDVTGHAKAETLTARNIAFSLAPMINAAGRIEKPGLAFDLLVTNDPKEAQRLALELHAINQERREIDQDLVERICEDIEREVAHTTEPFLVLADRDFHHGVTGIVAGRLKERYKKPVLLLSYHEDEVWKGSGRSLEGCHLYEALASCQDLLIGFGGHAQAAGCSVKTEHIPELRRRLNDYLKGLDWTAPAEAVWLDACPSLAEYDARLIEELEWLEPTGQGNPAPVLGLLHGRVLQTRTDRSGKHLFLNVDDGDRIAELVAWGKAEDAKAIGTWAHLAVRPRMKAYRGVAKVELQIDRLDKAEPPARPAEIVVSGAEGACGVRFDDQRQCRNRLKVLRERLSTGEPLAIYTGEALPPLELDRVVGQHPVQYWSDRQAAFGAVKHLVCWERPYSLDAWRRLTAGVSGSITLLWESPVVDPDLSDGWLQALYRELSQLRHLSWPQVLGRSWESPTLMVRSGLEMLREVGLLAVDGEEWELLAAPEQPVAVASLETYRTYRDAHQFRVLLANGSREDVLAALAHEARPVASV